MRRTDDQKLLEVLGGRRCPCGHLAQRHRKPAGVIPGEAMGACRDCDCRGLVSWSEDDDEAAA